MTHLFITTQEEEETSNDPFDLLPDDILLSIFQKLHDAKSLCLSMCACKRFQKIAPQVDQISYDLAAAQNNSNKKPLCGSSSDQETHNNNYSTSSSKNSFKNLLTKSLMKPFHFLSQMMSIKFNKSKNSDEENDLDFFSFHVPNRVLKRFETLRSLDLRLPCHNGSKKQQSSKKLCGGNNFSTFLKWKADFGREISSCVILGAKSWEDVDESRLSEKESSLSQETEQEVMSEDELKLRIVWTISCLIAASARHYLIQETIRDQKTLEKIVVSDESDQGRLCMNEEGIRDMREQFNKDKLSSSSSSSGSDENDDELVMEYRSKVPALKMKMWHLDRVEASGKVMKGATLVVIRPASDVEEEDVKKKIKKYDELVMGAFGEDSVLGEVVRKLMVAKRCYTLEMNSF